MLMKSYKWITAVSILVIAVPVFAQQQNQQNQNQQRSQQNQQNRQQRQGQANLQLDPEKWVRVAYDFDRDGKIDAVEEVYTFDLERARRSSQQRRQDMRSGQDRSMQREQDLEWWERNRMQDQRRPEQFRPSGQQDRQRQQGQQRADFWTSGQQDQQTRRQQAQQRQQQRFHRLEGKITNMKTINLSGQEGQHVVAKVDTQRGKARVDLGPKKQISNLNLQQGDQIRLVGVPGSINDKSMLIATRVRSDGGWTSINRPRSKHLMKFEGSLANKRTATFQGFDQDHVIALLETRQGKRIQTDLGPKDQLNQLDLSQGDRLSVLARPGRINGQPALIAEEIWSNDQNVKVGKNNPREGQFRLRTQQMQNRSRSQSQSQSQR